MSLRTYQARSMSDALLRVKEDLGRHAVILNTRTLRRGGVFGICARRMVEITATDARSMPAAALAPAHATADRAMTGASAAAPRAERPGPRPRVESAGALTTGRGETSPMERDTLVSAMRSLVRSELRTVYESIGRLESECRAARRPDLPTVLVEAYTDLIGRQVADELAREIVERLRPYSDSPDAVRQRLMEEIGSMVPTTGTAASSKPDGARRIALVGPTGMGKTTTIAKLAAHAKLREERRVGLITIDHYRIAAIDQLRTYAEILDVPFAAVASADEMRAALRRMSDCDAIFIDTAGRGPRDAPRIAELKALLAEASPDEVHLVLASTHDEAASLEAVRAFGELGADRILYTKLDEAVGFGVVLNVLHKVRWRLSYVTTGQSVPNDIAVADAAEVARLILGAESVTVIGSGSVA